MMDPVPLLLLLVASSANADSLKNVGEGVRAFRAGEMGKARRLFCPVADKGKTLIQDQVLRLCAQAELKDSQELAAQKHFAALEKKGGDWKREAMLGRADALWSLGEQASARAIYLDLLKAWAVSLDPERRGQVLYRAEKYKDLFVEQPQHALAEAAKAKLSATELTLADRIRRAIVLSEGRAWEQAIDELQKLPHSELSIEQRITVDYWIGMTKYKTRHDYAGASEKLLAVWDKMDSSKLKADALFHGGRALSRADRDDDAIAIYKKVVEQFAHPEASFLIGWLEFNRGKYAEAIPELERHVKRFGPRGRFSVDAIWYIAYSHWMRGDYEAALAALKQVSPDEAAGEKGAYWRGRALDKLGRKDEAVAEWQRAAARALTFYGQLSRLRLKERDIASPLTWSSACSAHAPKVAKGPRPSFARVDQLLAVGLHEEASLDLQRIPGQADAWQKLDRYARANDFYRLHREAEARDGNWSSCDPRNNKEARRWWEAVYPLAYRAFVEKHRTLGDNPPYYLYTIMLKESAFNPRDVSYADAIGLLQMIPPTSRRVAEKIATPYVDGILFEPEQNIRFGSWYIGHLLQKFKGQIALGAGAYNAGPKAMMKWIGKFGSRELDEFVELCPYTQTREYMKRVLGLYSRYLYLYEGSDFLPALKVDATFLDDGIDY